MQFEHDEADTDAECEPARHAEQTLAPACECRPAAQDPVTADRPDEAQNEPAGQASQETAPVAACIVPAEQLAHAGAPIPEYWPEAQLEQTEADNPE